MNRRKGRIRDKMGEYYIKDVGLFASAKYLKRHTQKRTCKSPRVDELSEMQVEFLGNDYIDKYGIDHDLWGMNMGPDLED